MASLAPNDESAEFEPSFDALRHVDHQTVARELSLPFHRAARRAGFWAYPEINVISGEDLFIPDLSVVRRSAAGLVAVDIGDVVLLVEIVSPSNRRKDVIDRPPVYARAGVPWFIRITLEDRIPVMELFSLVAGAYTPVGGTSAGAMFTMTDPFEFAMDPAALLAD